MLTALKQDQLRKRPCGCGEATLDSIGNVVRVESCPACLKNALDFLKEVCYDANTCEGMRLERQLDMFLDTSSVLSPSLLPPCLSEGETISG